MGQTALLPFRRKAYWEFFSPWKIRRFRPGLNPRTWVPKASTLPLDHRSRKIALKCCIFSCFFFISSKRTFLSYFFLLHKHCCLCLFITCLQLSLFTKFFTQFIVFMRVLQLMRLLLRCLQRAKLIPATLALQDFENWVRSLFSIHCHWTN